MNEFINLTAFMPRMYLVTGANLVTCGEADVMEQLHSVGLADRISRLETSVNFGNEIGEDSRIS